jgi:hypothetical protein
MSPATTRSIPQTPSVRWVRTDPGKSVDYPFGRTAVADDVGLRVTLMTIKHLSPDEMERLSQPENPAIAKLHELEIEEVNRRGGLTLEVFRLRDGFLFDNPVMMTSDAIAEELRLPASAVREAINEVDAAVDARWLETAEYQASEFPEVHRRRREGLPPWGDRKPQSNSRP